jgi:hypothetical protein
VIGAVVVGVPMSKPVLLLHNGNSTVKNKFAVISKLTPINTIANYKTLDSKIQFLKNNPNSVTDLTSADTIEDTELFQLKDFCRVIKIITSYDNDVTCLENVVNVEDFTYSIWLQGLTLRLWAVDEFYWMDQLDLNASNCSEAIIFSPGRTGTHVLADILKLPYLHHSETLFESNNFKKLTNSKNIFSILRINLYPTVISQSIAQNLNFCMTTTTASYNQNLKLIKSSAPFTISETDIKHSLKSIITFINLLLLLKIFYKKSISFTFLEYLTEHFDKINYIKNPYTDTDLVLNTEEVNHIITSKYQSIYSYSINQTIRHCGVSII